MGNAHCCPLLPTLNLASAALRGSSSGALDSPFLYSGEKQLWQDKARRWEGLGKDWFHLVVLFVTALFSPWRPSWLPTGLPTISFASNAMSVEENLTSET